MELLNRYKIEAELGRGAMGVVYRAHDTTIDRVVAIKTIHAEADPDDMEGFRRRFFREVRAAGRLMHPGIVAIFDAAEDEASRTPFIVMEYVAGKTLESILRDAAARPPRRALVEMARQIALALDHAHAAGIVHRDIKPANILVTPQGQPKITDFGVARVLLTQATTGDVIAGTPAYMSPEQVQGQRCDGRSDLFSLGVMLYWMLTGEKPFSGDSPGEVMGRITFAPHRPPSELNPSLPPDFDFVLARALEKAPARRYQRGAELAADLEDVQQGRAPRSKAQAAPGAAAAERTLEMPRESAATDSAARPAPHAPERTLQLPADSVKESTVAAPPAEFPGPAQSRQQRRRKIVRMVAGGAALLLVLAAALYFRNAGTLGPAGFPGPTATMNVSINHDFAAAELTIWLGEKELARRKIPSGSNFFEAWKIPPGRHAVRVRIAAPDAGYDATRAATAEFAKDQSRTLTIRCERRRNSFYMAWR
jgi:serine/threonine-protein kinase